jgi:hypothetical protein
VEEHWDWQVKRINDSDFSVIFPNAQSLKLCKNTGVLTLLVSKVSVLVVEPRVYQDSETNLAKVWVFLSDVPEVLRNEPMLMEATKMIGRPRLVDEASLAAPGPVRMLFHSQAPSRIPSSILLFANDQGFCIGLASEVIKAKGSPLLLRYSARTTMTTRKRRRTRADRMPTGSTGHLRPSLGRE